MGFACLAERSPPCVRWSRLPTEPLVCMAWVAAVTNTVRIGTSILVLPMRNPKEVAKSLATTDQLSGGRVVLGTAAGCLRTEFEALGVLGPKSRGPSRARRTIHIDAAKPAGGD